MGSGGGTGSGSGWVVRVPLEDGSMRFEWYQIQRVSGSIEQDTSVASEI
jgi:hypothetical protein